MGNLFNQMCTFWEEKTNQDFALLAETLRSDHKCCAEWNAWDGTVITAWPIDIDLQVNAKKRLLAGTEDE